MFANHNELIYSRLIKPRSTISVLMKSRENSSDISKSGGCGVCVWGWGWGEGGVVKLESSPVRVFFDIGINCIRIE